MNILVGIIGIALGFVCILYAYPIKQMVGSIGFFEKVFGLGGTLSGVKLVGVLLIILSFVWMTGTLQEFLLWIFGPILGKRPAIS